MENIPYTIVVEYSRDGGETSENKEISDIMVSRGEIKNITITLDEEENTDLISTIAGSITDSSTGTGINNAAIEIYTYEQHSTDADNIVNEAEYTGTLVTTISSDDSGKYSTQIKYDPNEIDGIYIKASCDGFDGFVSEYISISESIIYDISLNPSYNAGITGVVTDNNDMPLGGVSVIISDDNNTIVASGITDEKGCYTVLCANGTYTVTFEKDGYYSENQNNVNVFDNVTEIPNIVLQKKIFENGDGSAQNPYQVGNAEQLNAVRYDLTANYIQIADINLSEYSNWNPIGDHENVFDGTYDGQGYSIENLRIQIHDANDIQNDDLGLFGETGYSAIMKNIVLDNVDFDITYTNGALCIAALSGDSLNAKIDNIKVTGDINVDFSNTEDGQWVSMFGGIICWGRITNSSNYANITLSDISTNKVGGVVGYGVANNCTNYGNITANAGLDNLGGVIGKMDDSINNCANYGEIKIETNNCHVGGVVGTGSTNSIYVIRKCKNYGNLSFVSSANTSFNPYYDKTLGGIIGMGKNIDIYNCYNEGNLYCYGYAPRVGGIEGSMAGYNISGWISNCINNCTSIVVDNFSEVSEAYIGSICSSSFGSLGENYSYDAIRINGTIPTEYVGLDSLNGMLLSFDEIQEKINELILS